MSLIPKDIMDSLVESGLKLDDDGNVINEEEFINQDQDDDVDDLDDDLDDNNDNEDDVTDDLHDDDDYLDDDDDDDDDLDDDTDDKKVIKTSKKTLTIASDDDNVDEDNSEVEELKSELKQLRKLVNSNANSKGNEGEELTPEEELREEVRKFRKMRLDNFANDVTRRVNSLNLGYRFDDIIASKEWKTYQKSVILGNTVGKLYEAAIMQNDSDAVVSFFEDFSEKYLSEEKTDINAKKGADKKAKSKKSNLDDLAVPEKSKPARQTRKSKFDFHADDYGTKLELFERGKMSTSEWQKFENDFEKSSLKGRVKYD